MILKGEICVLTNKKLKEYVRVMKCVDVDEAVKQQIIRNCARQGTLSKIKTGRFKAVSVSKDQTPDEI